MKASDLGKQRVTVTVARLLLEDVGGDGEQKPVLYFEGHEKGLVLNKTNANAIVEIADTADYTEWPGVQILLFATTTEFRGKTVPCIRITAPPEGTKQVRKPEPETGDPSIPF